MKFQIKNREGQCMYYTESSSCVPVDKLESMHSAGLLFYLDGKKVSVNTIKSQFKDMQPIKVPKYRPAPKFHVENSDVSESEVNSNESGILSVDFTSVDFPITSRTIVCLNNNKVYRNQTEAAKDLKIDPSYISDCICHNKEYKGYKFKKAVDFT